MSSAKRIRRNPDEAKSLILRTAEKILLEEGYAAVTVRRIARDAGVTSALLHYYYPSADALLVALYRHSSARDMALLKQALEDPDPVTALWGYLTDKARTVLGVEFLALANHKEELRSEIVAYAEHVRTLQAEMLSHHLEANQIGGCTAEGLSMLLTSVSRNLTMEAAVGISKGHEAARSFVEASLVTLKTSTSPAEG